MKANLKFGVGFFLLVLVVSACGREAAKYSTAENPTSAPLTPQSGACPAGALKFNSAGVCGELTWKSGPSAEKLSSFELTFWKPGAPRTAGPIDPGGEVTSFLRMTCCGSLFVNKVNRVSPGRYEVTEVNFTTGDWEVFIQMTNPAGPPEKQFSKVTLE